MNNAQIAGTFEQLADLLEFQGANPFRLRAYRNGARTIRDHSESIESIVADDPSRLTEIDGIGKGVAEKCVALIETGEIAQLKELLDEVPKSVLALLRIPGLGPKKAAILFREMQITTLEQLQAACEAGKVRELKGFAKKTEELILQGISIAAAANERIFWALGDEIATAMREHLRPCKAISQLELAGSYRRGKETLGDLDVLVVATDPQTVMNHFGEFPDIEQTIGRGETKMSVRLSNGFQIDLRVVPEESFGAALQYFTGSKDHNVVVRSRAKQRGLKINEWGVFNATTDEYIAGATEKDVYAALDMPLFPPELREARREFDLAAEGELPRLIEIQDVCGDLHMHTTETDGKATILEMMAAARAQGLSYIAITDHSQRVTMAHGLDADRLRRQWEEIDDLNQRHGKAFTVLKGIECDILEAGGMDLQDDVLSEADWVVASIHYGQKQPRSQITERIVNALKNPHVSCIAHPTGRLLNRREPYDVDIEAVFEAAKTHGKMLELNANPMRLDLNDVLCAAAKKYGIPIVISSDAHSTDGLAVMRYGVLQARRAGLTSSDVANTRTWSQLHKLIGKPVDQDDQVV